MVWFNVDDNFYNHPKVKKIPAGPLRKGAVALWTFAGSWSSNYLQDGVIPAHQIPEFGGKTAEAEALVKVELWHKSGHNCPICKPIEPGNYIFHDWKQANPLRTEVQAKRATDRDRVRRYRERTRAASNGVTHGASNSVSNDAHTIPTHTNPSSSVVGSSRGEALETLQPATARPPDHCPKHPGGTDQPCAACGRARQAATDWDAAQSRARGAEHVNHRRAEREAAALERARCALCDADGYRLTPNGPGQWCNHQPLNPGGLARAQATLAEETP